jgi:hypothetical protein
VVLVWYSFLAVISMLEIINVEVERADQRQEEVARKRNSSFR